MIRLITFLCFITVFISASAQAGEDGKIFGAKELTLQNGMQVVVVENHRVPVVTHMVWYRTGAADEPNGTSGIAHFMEHLMFKGSNTIDGVPLRPGEFSKTIRSLGGQDNAFTSQDYTAYFQSVKSEHLETIMKMEAGRMRTMSPPPEEVLSERQVILEERRQRADNDPRGFFRETMSATLFPRHPYGIPVLGWKHEMEQLNWQDAKTFYDRWYVPNNAILIISGDIKAKAVFKMAQKTYGRIPKSQLPQRERTGKPPADMIADNNYVKAFHPAIRQPTLQLALQAPAFKHNKEESLALQILEEILGGGATSRLYQALVVNQKIASSAGFYYDGDGRDKGSVWLYGTPLPGISLDRIEAALKEVLSDLARNGVTRQELKDAKTRLQNNSIYARDSLTGPAMVIGRAVSVGMSLDDVEYWPRDIANIPLETVNKAARRWLSPDLDYVRGDLLPEASKDAL